MAMGLARLNGVSQPEADAPPHKQATLRAAVPPADAPVALRRRLGARRLNRMLKSSQLVAARHR